VSADPRPAQGVAPAPTVLPGGGDPAAEQADAPPAEESKGGSFWRELPVLVVLALLLAVLVKAFLFQAFYIPSGSMEQTLQIGDRVLVNKLVYRFRDIHRGEIVVFDGRESSFQPEVFVPEPANPVQGALRSVQGALGLGATGERDFIKRVIGLPGDVVECCDDSGRLSVNGAPLDESYLFEDDQRIFGPVTVPDGRLFLLGDHRGSSQDSRAYLNEPEAGSVDIDRVVGRAFVVVWPTGNARLLRQPDTFTEAASAPGATPAGLALAGAPVLLGAAGAVPVRAAGRRGLRALRSR
jgi:signal peptidase I